jgi:hypothetical protein
MDIQKQGRKRPAARFRPLSTRGKGRYTQIGFGAAFVGRLFVDVEANLATAC